MSVFTCRTCGVQSPGAAGGLPERCIICDDPRQYIGWGGQRWATLEDLRGEGFSTSLRELEPDLFALQVEPKMAIGQHGLIVRTEQGNMLWDVPGFVDEAAFAAVEALGGLHAVSASHPHFYGCMVEWATRFDAPIHLPIADMQHVPRSDPRIEFYVDEAVPVGGTRLVRVGGHFEGSAVLNWPSGAGGKGVLLTGDSIQVVMDRNWVSVMWSYPNHIPVDAATLHHIFRTIDPLPFDRIYGGFPGRMIPADAEARVRASFDRYLRRIGAR
ncbi:MAG TPA: hypothetical protein VLD62_12130 [Acidimicrobiia bacterium]|nr:hypothetical protein [Acidimicrobiia bacterium]